jgi:hypothetical protein
VHNASVGATIFQKLPTRQSQFLTSWMESPGFSGIQAKSLREGLKFQETSDEIETFQFPEKSGKISIGKRSIRREIGQNCRIPETTHPGSH